LAAGAAWANTSASYEAGTVRDKLDLAHPVLNYNFFTVSQPLSYGFSWVAAVQNARPAHGGLPNWFLEGYLGYRYSYSPTLSVYGYVGGGERLSRAGNFPVFAFRAGIDKKMSTKLTWNAADLRWRASLDNKFHYYSPVLGTGLTYQAADDLSLYTRLFASFDSDYRFLGTSVGVGVKTTF